MAKELTIENFPKLRASHVRMKDEAAVLRTINAIINGGANKLQVVTDFDRTVTKQHVNGQPVKSSFCIFEQSPLVPEKFKKKSWEYMNKYRPIEIDSTLPMNDKITAMEEWYTLTEEIISGLYMNPKEMRRMAREYGYLRERTKELFELMHRDNVPILVFSAGLGDVVEAILEENDIYLQNVKVVSNFLKFDGDKILGFKNKKLIHVFNKQEHGMEEKEYFEVLKGRSSVLLMGDTIGDASMAEGVEHLEAVLKIGFLYEEKEKNLQSFMDNYDIVLIDDQTMDVALDILKHVL